MKSLMAHFKNVFDYLFNAEWNPDYANAAHIKISLSTDERYPNEIRIAAIDSDGEIRSLCAYDADIALEPMSIEYEPADQASIATPVETEKIWWDDEDQEYNTIDYAIAKQWKYRLQTMREKSIAGINFSDALDVVITRGEYRTLSDNKQRELIQAWLYPTNDNGEIDCSDCADQASIAAPGETVLCKTHSDEKHYGDMREFFNDNLETLEFRPYMPFCSQCGNDKPVYIGLIPNSYNKMVSFAFCVDCRDELTLKRNAATAAQERIGA